LKNPVVLALFVFLAVVIAYAAYLGWAPSPQPASRPSDSATGLCREGDTRPCSVNSCQGVSRCLNGVWSGCRWDTVCTPGARVPCLSNGCVYAVKECDSCGTGYTDCFLPNSTTNGPARPQ
jgi:hypothetical protein